MEGGVLSPDHLGRFGVSKVFRGEDGKSSRITGLDFSRDGKFIATSGSDDLVKLYSSIDGKLQKLFKVKKHGASCIKFTHHCATVLEAGFRGQDSSVRYHSLHDNAYIRKFSGHQLPINNIDISPVSDSFLTSSQDNTVRIWDLRQETAAGMIQGFVQTPIVAFDNEGLIFGVGSSRTSLKLFDTRNYSAGAFTSFQFQRDASQSEWASMEFSPDSKHILVNTNQNFLMCLDAFTGKVSQTYSSHNNTSNIPLHGSFTPCSQFVCCGSTSGDVHIWNRDNAEEVAVWRGHAEPVTRVRWNPMREVCATAGSNVGLWIPRKNKSILKNKIPG